MHDLNHFCPPFERLEGGKSEEYQMEQARKDQEERNDNKESKETVISKEVWDSLVVRSDKEEFEEWDTYKCGCKKPPLMKDIPCVCGKHGQE